MTQSAADSVHTAAVLVQLLVVQNNRTPFVHAAAGPVSSLIMAALFMDLLVALTCKCMILFKNMLFVCAWVLTELLLRLCLEANEPPLNFKEYCSESFFRLK